MYTGRYDPPPGNNLAAYRRTQDGHGGRSAEHRAEMQQIAEKAIREIVPQMAAEIFNDTIERLIDAMEYDIETIVNISFDDAQDIFTSKKARKYVSDRIMRDITAQLKNMKIKMIALILCVALFANYVQARIISIQDWDGSHTARSTSEESGVVRCAEECPEKIIL